MGTKLANNGREFGGQITLFTEFTNNLGEQWELSAEFSRRTNPIVRRVPIIVRRVPIIVPGSQSLFQGPEWLRTHIVPAGILPSIISQLDKNAYYSHNNLVE